MNALVLTPTSRRLPPGRQPHPYGASALDWRVFAGGDTVAPLLDQVCADMNRTAFVRSFDDARAELFSGAPLTAPTVLIVDPWALDDEVRRDEVRCFDQRDRPWVGVLVVLDGGDPQSVKNGERLLQQVDAVLVHRFARRFDRLAMDAPPVRTRGDFAEAFFAVAVEAESQFLRECCAGAKPASARRNPDSA